MKAKRALTSAKILGPRYRCWRCKGRRRIPDPASFTGDTLPCPGCHHTDPTGAGARKYAPLVDVVAARRQAV